MELILIRHGKTTWNAMGKLQGQADPPLNQEGVKQAEDLANQFREEVKTCAVIYSSERQRALKVAKILKDATSISLFPDERLNSRNLGDFSGKTLEELENTDPHQFHAYISGDPDFIPPKGESTSHVLERTKNFLDFLKSKHEKNDKIIIISHRGNIGMLHYLITGKKMKDPIRTIKNCHPYRYHYPKK